MPSKIEIANMALALCGTQKISSFEEDSAGARLVSSMWDLARRFALAQHPWNFAITRKQLAALIEVPVYEFTKAFPLPTGALRIWQAGEPEQQITYRVEVVGTGASAKRCIVTNESSLKVVYIYDVEDTTFWSPAFCVFMAYLLACWICLPLMSDDQYVERLTKWAEKMQSRSRSTDAQEGTPPNIITSDWENGRIF